MGHTHTYFEPAADTQLGVILSTITDCRQNGAEPHMNVCVGWVWVCVRGLWWEVAHSEKLQLYSEW